VKVLRLLPRLHNTRFHGGSLRDGRAWREGVLSFKQRRCNETNQYHPTQQSPHENDWLQGNQNLHGRTSGDEERLKSIANILPRTSNLFRENHVHRDFLKGACLERAALFTFLNECCELRLSFQVIAVAEFEAI